MRFGTGMLWLLVGVWMAFGCFYDSRWGQAAPNQRKAAQRFVPATMGTSSAPRPSSVRRLSVRALATPSHAAETLDWERRFEELVEDANRVLAPELGLELEVQRLQAWKPNVPGDDLHALIKALAAEDPGNDVGWVVGLTGSTPKLIFAVHDLGVAELFGKHIVLRATNGAAEHSALTRAFPDLDESELERLYLKRKRHKAVAVFLHEIGHALGALHEPSASSFMSPHYDTKMAAFSQPTRALVRLTLDYRLAPEAERDTPAMLRALVAELESATPSVWVQSERESMLDHLHTRLAATGTAVSTAPVPHGGKTSQPTPPASTPTVLSPEARKVYAQAIEEERAGQKASAWKTARPLFAEYANVYEVQDLRCRLAMGIALPFEQVNEECRRLRELSGGWRGQ